MPEPTAEDPENTRTVTCRSKADNFGRKAFDEIQIGCDFISRQYAYAAGRVTDEHKATNKVKSSPTTQLVSQIVFSGGRTVSYEYDEEERITRVTDSADGVTEYTYDALGQLLTEKKTKNGTTTVVNTMTYDAYGNITSRNGKTYTYGNTAWRDLLTAYNGQSITYDAQGNPTSYLGHILTWEKGRQLKSFDNNTYTYNAKGIRTSKTVNGTKHTYTLEGTKILCEAWGDNTLIPLRDNTDTVCGILYNNVPYYFQRNLQGDIIGILNKDAETVATYSYDAWGVCNVVTDTSGCNISTINPFRYRGYYYDEEIGLYYLQSRYYDPAVGRFVNADEVAYLSADRTLTGLNLITYCLNTPCKFCDPFGTWVISVGFELSAAYVFGIYGGLSVNIDQDFNVSIMGSIGGTVITNVAASIQFFISQCLGFHSVSQLNGWSFSAGAGYSCGVNLSFGASFVVGFDGSMSDNISLGAGLGVSLVPVPYLQVKLGFSFTIVSFNLFDLLKKAKRGKKCDIGLC